MAKQKNIPPADNESTNSTESVIAKEEFMSRLEAALEKFSKGPQEAVTEEEIKMAKIHLARNVGSKISHLCTENTMQVIDLVSLMIEGKYQNDRMLVLIEEMPEIGYGH